MYSTWVPSSADNYLLKILFSISGRPHTPLEHSTWVPSALITTCVWGSAWALAKPKKIFSASQGVQTLRSHTLPNCPLRSRCHVGCCISFRSQSKQETRAITALEAITGWKRSQVGIGPRDTPSATFKRATASAMRKRRQFFSASQGAQILRSNTLPNRAMTNKQADGAHKCFNPRAAIGRRLHKCPLEQGARGLNSNWIPVQNWSGWLQGKQTQGE
mgnify:FL=1